MSEIERAAMPDHAELIREIAKLLASRVEAAMQHTFRLELADAASGKPFDPEQRREHLMILFAEIIKEADDSPVAILNHNRPEAYLLPAAHYERLMEYLEDLEDAKLTQERANGPFIEVSLNEL